MSHDDLVHDGNDESATSCNQPVNSCSLPVGPVRHEPTHGRVRDKKLGRLKIKLHVMVSHLVLQLNVPLDACHRQQRFSKILQKSFDKL